MKKVYTTAIIIIFIMIKVFNLIQIENKIEDIKNTNNNNTCIGLNYHRIRDRNIINTTFKFISRDKEMTTYSIFSDTFEKQIDTLIKKGAYFATLDELDTFREKGEYPKNCVWISFDDGEKSVYDIAYPILKEKNIPFTIFIISGQVGNKDFDNLEMVSWENLREMRDSGLVSFGSHTHDMHYLEDDKAEFLIQDNYKKFRDDIETSKSIMEKELDLEINSIAYPFGESSDDIAYIVKNTGFNSAYILSSNPIDEKNDRYYQNRYLVTTDNFEKIIKFIND